MFLISKYIKIVAKVSNIHLHVTGGEEDIFRFLMSSFRIPVSLVC